MKKSSKGQQRRDALADNIFARRKQFDAVEKAARAETDETGDKAKKVVFSCNNNNININ